MTTATIDLAAYIGRKTRSLTSGELSALDLADCTTCGRPASEARGGRNGVICDHLGRITGVECVPCWNAGVAEREAQRKAELAARPKCEACGRKPYTWTLGASDGPVNVCGTCRNRVNRAIRTPMLFGAPSASRARILEVARS